MIVATGMMLSATAHPRMCVVLKVTIKKETSINQSPSDQATHLVSMWKRIFPIYKKMPPMPFHNPG